MWTDAELAGYFEALHKIIVVDMLGALGGVWRFSGWIDTMSVNVVRCIAHGGTLDCWSFLRRVYGFVCGTRKAANGQRRPGVVGRCASRRLAPRSNGIYAVRLPAQNSLDFIGSRGATYP